MIRIEYLNNKWIKAGLLILAVFSFVYMFNMSAIPQH